jgi:hypothetical protein
VALDKVDKSSISTLLLLKFGEMSKSETEQIALKYSKRFEFSIFLFYPFSS